ncbi:MAG: DNA-protecting protein DprA [Bacteroidales bacterium]|nr:DNA-protecting protein DprA [Bacteroidales bacterium]
MDSMSFDYTSYKSKFSAHELKHAPEKLFFEGNIDLLLKGTRVSVVGSRKPSEDGIKRAELITKELIKRDIVVVSGLASGIDTIAHVTAMKNSGKTIAVLGTPLDKVYPSQNKGLLDKIKKEHLAISQFGMGYPFQKQNFPTRNRTMALISDSTIIIEASENSGTKHQGWEALRLGRMVFILSNVVESNSWAKEMINYGAQVMTRDDFPGILDDIPNFTSIFNVELCL